MIRAFSSDKTVGTSYWRIKAAGDAHPLVERHSPRKATKAERKIYEERKDF